MKIDDKDGARLAGLVLHIAVLDEEQTRSLVRLVESIEKGEEVSAAMYMAKMAVTFRKQAELMDEALAIFEED